MSRVCCYPSPGKRKGFKVCKVFAEGCGGRLLPKGHPYLEDGPGFFYGWTRHTVPLIEQCQAQGRTWFYADNAYYFGREQYFRVTRNALMHDGSGKARPERFRTFGLTVQPWRKNGRHVLVATQSELFYQMHLGLTRQAWTDKIKAELARHTDRPIVVCHKPPPPWPNHQPHHNFEDVLPDAWAVVTYSSSVMVKALLDGIPVFSTGPSMASCVGLSDLSRLEAPYMPSDDERLQWFCNLAANQWTREEMRDGICWRDLQTRNLEAAA